MRKDAEMDQRGFLHGRGNDDDPVTSYAVTDADDVIGPVVLERVCDCGKSQMSAEDWKIQVENHWNHGCGTRFRWYLGVPCFCPHCGWAYSYTNDDLRKKLFFVSAHS
jgi:hypothetical protein